MPNKDTMMCRVFWSPAEKARIVQRAMEHPELAGLPLLRIAMMALPAGRRRKLIASTQVPWFDDALKDEAGRRAVAADELRTLMARNLAANCSCEQLLKQILSELSRRAI